MFRQWKFAVLGAASLIVIFLSLHYSRKYSQENAMNSAIGTLERVMNYADERIHQTENAADKLIPLIEQHLDEPDLMFEYSRQLLKDNPDLKGCSISFEPFFFKQKGQYFSAYSYNNNGTIETEQEGDDGYQYFYMDW